MSLKLFCKSCKGFIRDVSQKEMRSVTGEEICEACGTDLSTTIATVKKIAAKGIEKIAKAEAYVLAEIDKQMKKVSKEAPKDTDYGPKSPTGAH